MSGHDVVAAGPQPSGDDPVPTPDGPTHTPVRSAPRRVRTGRFYQLVMAGYGLVRPATKRPRRLSSEDDVLAIDTGKQDALHGATGEQREPGWRVIVDAMSDPALVLDGQGNIVHHNPLVADLFERVRIGQPITHLSRNPELLEAVSEVLNKGERLVVHLHDRVPVMRRISAIITALTLDEPQAGGPQLLVVLRDLTDQERHAQMRSDFISHASHELRTPLASLVGFVDTLRGNARNDEAARERFLALMAAQASRMTRLIDDLLSLSRVEMRVHLPPRGVAELNEVLNFVVQSLEPLAEGAGAQLRLVELQEPARVTGERDELVQVFQNLVQNAIKYGRDNGNVLITLKRERVPGRPRSRIVVAVTDDGPGIPEEHLPRLTERFYRVNATRSREKGGTGLGLAIVKHIVMRHRGDLRIRSVVGVGSTFEVALDELPAATAGA